MKSIIRKLVKKFKVPVLNDIIRNTSVISAIAFATSAVAELSREGVSFVSIVYVLLTVLFVAIISLAIKERN